MAKRIHVIGNSCAGKSTLAEALGAKLGIPVVELDAPNWLPSWVGLNEHDPERLERRILDATREDAWILAGSYESFCRRLCWHRLDTIVWLDRPLPLLLLRFVRRSWRRWHTQELLWGTNRETFWPQFAVWRKQESLLWWIVTQHQRKREAMLSVIADPQWRHINVVRLRSDRDVEEYVSRAGEGEVAQ